MTETVTTDEVVDRPPSYFASLGKPCCSCWAKSELESIALAYVQALAADGDTWKTLSREQTYSLLTEEQQRPVYNLLTRDFYKHWFEAVSGQITGSAGAFGVGGFWR